MDESKVWYFGMGPDTKTIMDTKVIMDKIKSGEITPITHLANLYFYITINNANLIF